MPITNPKVASIEPRWAPFRGFSLLFDNPGASVSPMGERLLVADCSLNGNDELALYRRFVGFLDAIGTHRLRDSYSFCPLPPYSYHVTRMIDLSAVQADTTKAEVSAMAKDTR